MPIKVAGTEVLKVGLSATLLPRDRCGRLACPMSWTVLATIQDTQPCPLRPLPTANRRWSTITTNIPTLTGCGGGLGGGNCGGAYRKC